MYPVRLGLCKHERVDTTKRTYVWTNPFILFVYSPPEVRSFFIIYECYQNHSQHLYLTSYRIFLCLWFWGGKFFFLFLIGVQFSFFIWCFKYYKYTLPTCISFCFKPLFPNIPVYIVHNTLTHSAHSFIFYYT